MASQLALICRLNHFKAINIRRENKRRGGSVNVWFLRHYSEDFLSCLSLQTDIMIAGQLSPR